MIYDVLGENSFRGEGNGWTRFEKNQVLYKNRALLCRH